MPVSTASTSWKSLHFNCAIVRESNGPTLWRMFWESFSTKFYSNSIWWSFSWKVDKPSAIYTVFFTFSLLFGLNGKHRYKKIGYLLEEQTFGLYIVWLYSVESRVILKTAERIRRQSVNRNNVKCSKMWNDSEISTEFSYVTGL